MAQKKVELYSKEYYGYCGIGSPKRYFIFTYVKTGGILSCGLTHTFVTPLDLVKCNTQVNIRNFITLLILQANPKEFTGTFQVHH